MERGGEKKCDKKMVLTAASSSRRASIWVLQKLDIRCEWEMSGIFWFCFVCCVCLLLLGMQRVSRVTVTGRPLN